MAPIVNGMEMDSTYSMAQLAGAGESNSAVQDNIK